MSQIQTQSAAIDRVIDIARGTVHATTIDWEHRAFKRRACDGWVALVHVDQNGEKTPAITLRSEDIGAGGMRVYSWHELPVGTRAGMLLRKTNGEPVLLGARVVYCCSRGRIDFECGLKFAPMPSIININDFREPDGALMDLGPALSAA